MENSIQNLILQKIQDLGKNKTTLNERQTLIKELHEVYILENKVENWCRYLHWKKKTKGTPEEFKKAKLPINQKYIKPNTPSYFAIRLSHIPTGDLYYLISEKNDFKNRKKYQKSAFTKWLFFSIKAK